MAYIPIEVHKDAERSNVLGTSRIADAFVPDYDTPTAIRVPARPRHQTLERRQLGRLLERRRLSS